MHEKNLSFMTTHPFSMQSHYIYKVTEETQFHNIVLLSSLIKILCVFTTSWAVPDIKRFPNGAPQRTTMAGSCSFAYQGGCGLTATAEIIFGVLNIFLLKMRSPNTTCNGTTFILEIGIN